MNLRQLGLFGLELSFQLRNLAVLNLRGARQVAGIAGLIQLQLELFQLRLRRAHSLDGFFLGLPLCFHAGGLFFQVGDPLLDLAQSILSTFVFLSLQSLALDFELHDFTFELIDVLR